MIHRCPACFADFEVISEHFYVDRRSPSGFDTYCKPCRKQKNADTHQRYKEKRNADSRKKYHANPKLYNTKAKEYRSKHKDRNREVSRSYYLANKERILKTNAANRALIPDKMAAYKRTYVERHPERRQETRLRDRLRRLEILKPNEEVIEYLKLVKNDPCCYCGQRKDRMTMDHIVPIVAGGKHEVGNLIRACRNCNSRKHAKPLFVFLAKQWSYSP